MKLQGSGPANPKTLQSQNRLQSRKGLSVSRLALVHGQRERRGGGHHQRHVDYLAISRRGGLRSHEVRMASTAPRTVPDSPAMRLGPDGAEVSFARCIGANM